jgi:4-hydroxy-3-polyprenylbenzoate decarboxylase
MSRILVCITGASGALYAVRLISLLASREIFVHVTCSTWGGHVVLEETGRPLGYWLDKVRSKGGANGKPALLTFHDSADLSAPISSGSFRLDGTVIVPCSTGTMGALASGTCSNLIHRAGAVALKEGWPLVVVPRETPLSLVSLKGMESLKDAGATILPASPSFYMRPSTIEQLVDSIVFRIMDQLGLPDPAARRWQ